MKTLIGEPPDRLAFNRMKLRNDGMSWLLPPHRSGVSALLRKFDDAFPGEAKIPSSRGTGQAGSATPGLSFLEGRSSIRDHIVEKRHL